jgi:hypothetical protein
VRTRSSSANFCLIEVPDGARVVAALREAGIAVRPAESFPGPSRSSTTNGTSPVAGRGEVSHVDRSRLHLTVASDREDVWERRRAVAPEFPRDLEFHRLAAQRPLEAGVLLAQLVELGAPGLAGQLLGAAGEEPLAPQSFARHRLGRRAAP